MSYEPSYYSATWDEDGTKYVLARITRPSTAYSMVIASATDFSSITRAVYAVPSSTVISASTALTLASVVLSAYSTGNIWDADGTGFNFVDRVPSTCFPNAGVNELVEYKFTLTSGDEGYLRVRGPVLGRTEGS